VNSSQIALVVVISAVFPVAPSLPAQAIASGLHPKRLNSWTVVSSFAAGDKRLRQTMKVADRMPVFWPEYLINTYIILRRK
jgi:hypothetical protein